MFLYAYLEGVETILRKYRIFSFSANIFETMGYMKKCLIQKFMIFDALYNDVFTFFENVKFFNLLPLPLILQNLKIL